jgi:hypothetical protein
MSEIPIAVGDAEAQKRFLASHEPFLREYHELDTLLKKVFMRAFVTSTHQVTKISEGLKLSPEEQIKAEDLMMAVPVVFSLGRIAADDFGELLTLAGNGRGIGAYKILRGMYERVVTAAFIAKNPAEARPFLIHSYIQRWKLWKRTVEIKPEIEKQVPPQEIQELEHEYSEARKQMKAEICKTCGQPNTQEAWTRTNLDTMATHTDPSLAVAYAYCYLLPTFHAHATAFGLESRFTHTEKGYSYKELSEGEAHSAVLNGHGLILRLLKQQNSYFNLGLDAEIEARWKMFPQIWGNKDKDAGV